MNSEEYKAAANYWRAKEYKQMPPEQLKILIEQYLADRSVCALATGSGDYVRCTPLEYGFHDGKLWIFTEGGEKFIGLEHNSNVSVAVFDQNPSFNALKSVQIAGRASIIEPMSPEYIAHAEHKKIPVASLEKLIEQGHALHLICIEPLRIDALFSEFKEQGYDSRQVLDYVQQ